MRLSYEKLYTLQEFAVTVCWDHPALTDSVQTSMHRYGLRPIYEGPSPADSWQVELYAQGNADLEFPNGTSPSTGPQISGIQIIKDGDDIFLKRAGAVVRITPSLQRVVAVLPIPTARSQPMPDTLSMLITSTLLILFGEHGFYELEATVLSRGKNSRKGLLLVAGHDTGKSTIAMSLLRQGWNFLSDDSVFLSSKAQDIVAYSQGHSMSLDPVAAAFFPEITAYSQPLADNPDKWDVDVKAIYGEQCRRACRPAVLVFPEIVDKQSSSIVELNPSDAFVHLMRHLNLGMYEADSNKKPLDVLNKLVLQTRAFRLKAGRDLLRIPERSSQLLIPLFNGEERRSSSSPCL